MATHFRKKTGKYSKKITKARRRSTRNKGRSHNRQSSRKQRGGTCYGRGVGANTGDPNFSIYNTPALQLFPYKPVN
jgi:hypothetical protein